MSGLNIAIIGNGNVGSHLFIAFSRNKENQVSQISKSNIGSLNEDFDVIFLAVRDDQISSTSEQIQTTKPLLLHVSGSVEIESLDNYDGPKGVFYPLQTFRKEIPMEYNKIPVLIESDSEYLERLKTIANQFSDRYEIVNSEERKKIHLSAVVVNNFANHLFGLNNEFMEKEGLDPSLLRPLLDETLERLGKYKIEELQTGPAMRGDQKTIEKHLKMLDSNPSLKKLYRSFSDSIREKHQA